MQIVKQLDNIRLDGFSVALGTFDGVHIGHRAVIRETVNSGLTPAVFTFDRPPSGAKCIMTSSVKLTALEALGINTVIMTEFDSVRNLQPRQFIQCFSQLGVKHISCGYNFRFGKNAAGNAALLEMLCREFGIGVTVIGKVDGCSSSIIRADIENGDLSHARKIMLAPFEYDFKVSHGANIGGDIMNTPTINQLWDEAVVVPKAGVYASETLLSDGWHKSITNIGTAPTVNYHALRSETHIFDYSGDLYGIRPRVRLYKYIREERKFDSKSALKEQISSDCELVKSANYKNM